MISENFFKKGLRRIGWELVGETIHCNLYSLKVEEEFEGYNCQRVFLLKVDSTCIYENSKNILFRILEVGENAFSKDTILCQARLEVDSFEEKMLTLMKQVGIPIKNSHKAKEVIGEGNRDPQNV